MMETFLRGAVSAALEQDDNLEVSTLGITSRTLQDDVTNPNHSSQSSAGSDSDAFLMFMTIIPVICYFACMAQFIRMCFCQGNSDEMDEPEVGDGSLIFTLTTRQRRAVLEYIFSDTSKAVTKDDLLKTDTKVAMGGDTPEKDAKNDEIPPIPESGTNDTMEIPPEEASDLEANCTPSSTAIDHPERPQEEPTSLPDSPKDAADTSSDVSNVATPEFAARRFSWQDDSPESTPDLDLPMMDSIPPNDALCLPTLGEEECKEEEVAQVSVLPKISTVASTDSIVPNSSYDTDYLEKDDENVCPICLSAYQEGEVLLTSKYCSHFFHKECIFEWLDNHDVCPCCRVEMVTAGEINKAASSLVGKERMSRAVPSGHLASTQATNQQQNRTSSVRRVGQVGRR